jgi:hypothetical protein
MYPSAPIVFNHREQTLKFAQEVETPPMETLLRCSQAIASNHLIELVDRVMERHPHKGKFRSRRKLFSWLRRDLVRPSLNRPSQKVLLVPRG